MAAALLPYAAECVSWELSDPPPPCIYCNPFSTSNALTLSRGCRRFCRTTLNIVSVCLASYEQISEHHRSESPTIGIRAVAEAPNWGGANACDTRRPPMMKGEDTKESWCRWSCQAERRRSSKHRNRGGGLRGVYRNFLFLCNQWQLSLP